MRVTSSKGDLGAGLQESERPDYMNERVFQRNRLQPRAYHLPAETQCLSGKWRFHYASSPLEPEPSPEESGAWSLIDVPGELSHDVSISPGLTIAL